MRTETFALVSEARDNFHIIRGVQKIFVTYYLSNHGVWDSVWLGLNRTAIYGVGHPQDHLKHFL